MPASYEIYDEWHLKFVRIGSAVELAELRDLAADYFDGQHFCPSHRYLVDARRLAQSSAGFRDAFSLYSYYQSRLKSISRPVTVVIVAPGDFAFGLSHMFLALANMGRVMTLRIVETMAEASELLEVPDGQLRDMCQSDGNKV